MIERHEHAIPAELSALPHPSGRFATNGHIADEFRAQVLVSFIQDATMLDPESRRAIGARWFLLESQQAYFMACDGAGIDGAKLRAHLKEQFEVKA